MSLTSKTAGVKLKSLLSNYGKLVGRLLIIWLDLVQTMMQSSAES
ncbi:MAG: hypothetical protein VZR95_05790 [Alphaproteobacteria bacterium]